MVDSVSVRLKNASVSKKMPLNISYAVECGNRLRVEVRAKNAGVSGFACRPFSGEEEPYVWVFDILYLGAVICLLAFSSVVREDLLVFLGFASDRGGLALYNQKSVRNPNHHHFSKKYRNTPPICIAIRLQFASQYFWCPYALRK